jgi:hypothetical protein
VVLQLTVKKSLPQPFFSGPIDNASDAQVNFYSGESFQQTPTGENTLDCAMSNYENMDVVITSLS